MRRALPMLALTLLQACSEDLAPPGGDGPPVEAGAPAVSEEMQLGGPQVQVTGADAFAPLQIALGAGEYLAVWSDLATGRSRVVGARVGLDGTALDPLGTTIASGFRPGVASDGEGFLVVMLDERFHVRGARVGQDGSVLDPGGFPISDHAAQSAAIAFDGANYLVAWIELPDIVYARVSPGGEVLGQPGRIESAGENIFDEWRGLACGAGTCLVAWFSSTASTLGARIDADGNVLDPDGIELGAALPIPLLTPSIAFDGASFVVAWTTLNGVLAGRVSPGGVALDPGGIAVGGFPFPTNPTAAFDGASTLIVWRDDLDQPPLRVKRLSPDGELLDAQAKTLVGNADGVAIAGHGEGSFMAWLSGNRAPGAPRLVGTRLSQAVEALDAPGIPLHTVANTQQLPAVALDGERFLAAWVDSAGRETAPPEAAWDLYATRVTPSGTVLDPDGVLLARGLSTSARPRLVFDGSSTLALFWQVQGACIDDCNFVLRGVRVGPGGDVLDPAPIEVPLQSTLPGSFSAASNGAGAFIAHVSAGLALGVRLDATGEVADLRSFGTASGPAAVASDGEGYLVVWSVGDASESALFGVRIGADGGVLDAGGITIAAPRGAQHSPSATFDGARYVVAWEREEGAPGEGRRRSVLAARVTPAGEVLDPEGILIAEAGSRPTSSARFGDVAVQSDGGRTFLAWRGLADPGDPASSVDLFGATLGADGVPGPAFTILAAAEDEGDFELGAWCGGALVLYERFLPDAPIGARRMMARRIDFDAEGGACAEASGAALVGSGGCRAAGAPPGGGGWVVAALAGVLAAARRAAGAAQRGEGWRSSSPAVISRLGARAEHATRAAICPRRAASSTGRPSSTWLTRKPAASASPAPLVSTTGRSSSAEG